MSGHTVESWSRAAAHEVPRQAPEDTHPGSSERIVESADDAARDLFMQGHFEVDLQPGDMTLYRLFGVRSRDGILIGYMNHGAYVFPLEGWAHAGYAGEKLGIANHHGARVVADFINVLTAIVARAEGDRVPA